MPAAVAKVTILSKPAVSGEAIQKLRADHATMQTRLNEACDRHDHGSSAPAPTISIISVTKTNNGSLPKDPTEAELTVIATAMTHITGCQRRANQFEKLRMRAISPMRKLVRSQRDIHEKWRPLVLASST